MMCRVRAVVCPGEPVELGSYPSTNVGKLRQPGLTRSRCTLPLTTLECLEVTQSAYLKSDVSFRARAHADP